MSLKFLFAKVDEPCLMLPDLTVATLRSLLNSLLTQGGGNLGSEEQQVLRTWAVEERFWRRREEATIQIVGRRDIEIEEEVEVKVEGLEKRERRQVEGRKEAEVEEEDVAIIWRQEEEEAKPKPVATSAVSNNGRKMLCKVCDISFQGRPYSDYQASQLNFWTCKSTSRLWIPDPIHIPIIFRSTSRPTGIKEVSSAAHIQAVERFSKPGES